MWAAFPKNLSVCLCVGLKNFECRQAIQRLSLCVTSASYTEQGMARYTNYSLVNAAVRGLPGPFVGEKDFGWRKCPRRSVKMHTESWDKYIHICALLTNTVSSYRGMRSMSAEISMPVQLAKKEREYTRCHTSRLNFALKRKSTCSLWPWK